MAQKDFSPRMQQILKVLLEERHAIPVQALADRVRVSKRTVQRELEYLPRPLKKHGIQFCSKTGTGVWLEGEEEAKRRLLDLLGQEVPVDSSDRNERRKRLVLEILKDKSLKKLYYYSDLFGISEATVSSDLEAVEGWFSSYHLNIVRKPGYGVIMEGSEKDFRRALRAFIDENIDTRIIREMYEEQSQEVKNIYHVLDDEILKKVTACILRIRDRRILNLTENSYVGLVIHVTIAVNRILKQEIIEDDDSLTDALLKDEAYQLAGRVAEELEREFGIAIPQIERAYICLHIQGAKIQQMELDEESIAKLSESRELWEVVNEMIDCYDRDIAYLLKQDEEFVVQGLIAHLKPTLVRLANGMKIQNPLLEQIKSQYGDIYERCQEVAKVIERHYGYEVPESEIGFLAIHFGAAKVRLDSRKENRRTVEVGIVCASGIGISRLMSSKISQNFSERVELHAYGMADLTPFVLERMDFFVSTMPMKEEGDVVYVSPLLTREDMEKIGKKVSQYEYTPKETKDKVFTRQLEQVNYVAVQIKNLIGGMGYLRVEPGITMEELLKVIGEDQTPYGERQLMIREDLMKREQMNSQIFPDFGFALFHTRTRGVMKPSFSVCVTRGRGAFTDSCFKQIRAVIVMLLPIDDHVRENREILGYISEKLVEEEAFLDTIMDGGKEEVREFLATCLRQFFQQYLDRV